jgi:gluconolactonase
MLPAFSGVRDMMLAIVLAVLPIAGQSEWSVGPVEVLAEGFVFTEGPVWHEERWLFSDPGRDGIYELDGSPFLSASGNSNGLLRDRQGRLLICQQAERRVARIEADGSLRVIAAAYDGNPFNAPNDIVERSDGRLFFTDPKPLRADAESPLGFSGVYTVHPDTGDVTLLADDIKYPNGIALSPDERTLYVADTSSTEVRAYDLATDGAISNGRRFCEVRIPDGMAVDQAGRLWVAASGGVAVFTPEGMLLDTIRVRPMPTNCAFGGTDGRTLLITARTVVAAVKTPDPGLGAAVDPSPAKP